MNHLDASKLEPLHVARALKKIIENDKFDAVFLGKQVQIKNNTSLVTTCLVRNCQSWEKS